MIIAKYSSNPPKDRRAALNLASVILDSELSIGKRKENLMKNIKSTQEKLDRLSETLENYKKQIEVLNQTSDQNQETLNWLKQQFQITQAEIVATQAELVHKQLLELEKKAAKDKIIDVQEV